MPEQQKPPDSEEYPPLLKHIMSSGSMVSEIEKHQIQPEVYPPPSAMDTGLPDLTQPPPTHPAYRGPSPNLPKPGPAQNNGVTKAPVTESGPFSVKGPPPQMISGNLSSLSSGQQDAKLPRSKSMSESSRKISPRRDADSRKISPHRDTEGSAAVKKVPSPVTTKTASLLTPGELLQSSGGATGYTAAIEKVR